MRSTHLPRLAWFRAPGATLLAVGVGVSVWANVHGGWWGYSEDQVELASLAIAALGCLVYLWARLATLRQLRISDSELRLLVSQMPADVWTTDTELRLTSVFGALPARLEFPQERVPGRTLYEVFGTADPGHPVIAAHLRALNGETATYERVAGEMVLEGQVEPLRDGRGCVIGCAGVAMDVSTWRWAERQVRRFGALVESSQDAIVSTSMDGTIETWNRAAEKLYGYTAQEAVGRPISLLYPPHRVGDLRRNLDLLARGESIEPYDTERVRKDGTLISVMVSVSPIRDGAGKVVGLSGIARDIAERKRAEAVSRRLAAMVESSHEAIVGATLDGTIESWNAAAERLLGYSADEILGRSVSVIFQPERLDEMRRNLEAVARDDRVELQETTRLRKDGVAIPVSVTLSPIKAGDGRLVGISGIVRDITERQRAEESLRQSEAMFRLMADNATDIITRHAPDGTFRYVSPACQKLLGYDAQDLVGRSPLDFIHPHDATAATPSGALLHQPTSYSVTFRFRRKDGTYAWLESLGHAELDRTTGVVTEIHAASRDVTDRILAEEQLRRQGEELRALARHLESVREEEHTRMAREIHDELGQGLTALRLDLSWLGKKLPEAGAAVQRRIGAMVALTDETIEAGRRIVAELRPPILDDLGLVPALEWYVQHFAKRAGLRCELDLGDSTLAVDRDLAVIVYRIVQEALTNVARYAQAKHVAVRLGEQDGALTLEVHDDWRGIREDAIASPHSLGIVGMRERAGARGGSLTIDRAPEGGTTVRLTIPAERRREPRESP